MVIVGRTHILLDKLIPNILSTQMETTSINELIVASVETELLERVNVQVPVAPRHFLEK